MANNWVTSNAYLGTSDQQNNALCVYNWLRTNGWSLNATAAVLGNMQSESTINPGIWESLTVDYTRGFGLVQWTPATKYTSWAGPNYTNGNLQCARLDWETTQGSLQWFRNPDAPLPNPTITFAEFKVSELPVQTLAYYFLWYYEHPADVNQPNRAEQAQSWLTFLRDRPIVDPGPTPDPVGQRTRRLPLWMMLRAPRRRR